MGKTDFVIGFDVFLRCSACGRLYRLGNGKRLVLLEQADAHLGVVKETEGPCPGCAGPGDGGEELPMKATG